MTDNVTQPTKPIGILGGTFDPIHHGHLRLALELYEQLNLAEVRFIPNAIPPHRSPPVAEGNLRFAMVQRAIQGATGMLVDDREFHRHGPSYMIDTLQSLRLDYPTVPLCLIIGMDEFIHLHQWYQWEHLIELAHLLVVQRAGVLPVGTLLRDFLLAHQVYQWDHLTTQVSGCVFFVENIPTLAVSATQIRVLFKDHRNPRYLLPDTVLDFINTHQLYR
jgi:nicotinate-nucleotide adenylyltransferase